MRIAMFSEVPTFNPILPNGISSFIEAVSKQLVKLGHEIHVFEQIQYFGQKRKEEIRNNITIHRTFSLPMSRYQDMRTPFPLGVVFRGTKEKFDIIHAHGPVLGIAASILAKKQGVPKIVTYHTPGKHYVNYIPRTFSPLRAHTFIDWWEKIAYNSFDLILTPAPKIKKDLTDRGFAAKKIFVLPNCVDLNENHKRITPERVQSIRDRYDLNGKKIVVYVGRMSPEKRVPNIINLVPQIIKENPDSHFLMVGKGPYLDSYRSLAKKVAPKDITFTGYVSNKDLSNIMQMCTIGVIFVDGAQVFDITILNYWSNQLPVCARKAGGMVDVIRHNDNGLLFTQETEASSQILTLLQDAKLRKKLGTKGYETVKNKYSVERVTQQLLDYYKLAAQKFHIQGDNFFQIILKYLSRIR